MKLNGLILLSLILLLLSSCYHVEDYYSIEVKDDRWVESDVREPFLKPGGGSGQLLLAGEIAHTYRLKNSKYSVEVFIDPNRHEHATTIDFQVHNSFSKKLSVKADWDGICGNIILEFSEHNRTVSDPIARGFDWRCTCYNPSSNTGECSSKAELVADMNLNPTALKMRIYDEEQLVGTEEVTFKIFQNGYWIYSVGL